VATFGKTTDGTGNSQSSTDRKKVSSASPSTSGTATSITIRGRVGATSTVIKGVIYSDNAGAPDALLAVSDEITVNSTTEQNWTGALSGGNQISLTSGTTYWIGWIQQDPGAGASDYFEISRDGTASMSQTNTDTYSDGPTNPFGAPTAESGPVDVFVTYTEVGGGSGPTVRSAAGASGAAGNDPAVVTKPSGLAVGDLMLAFHVGDNDALLANMTAPASWTEIASQAAVTGAQPAMKVWHRIATSTETAASNFSFSAGGGGVFCSAGILAITVGTFDPTAPLSPAFTINASNSTAHVAPSLTGIVNGLLVTAHSTDQGGASSTSYTPPSGMTEHVDTAASTGWTCVEVNTLAVTSTAATGTKTATCTHSRPATSVSLIVSPAPSDVARRTAGFLTLL
jgi:hypothetical protein